MTFYNIIFGILFLGALGSVVRSLSQDPLNLAQLFESLTLLFLIASDSIFTSMTIEECDRPYTHRMKLIDLANFVLLAFALLIVDPDAGGGLNMNLGPLWQKFLNATHLSVAVIFWIIIGIYWAMLVWWNWEGERIGGCARRLWERRVVFAIQPLMAMVSLAAAAYFFNTPVDGAETAVVVEGTLCALSFVYLIGYKPFVTRFFRTETVKLMRLKPEDAKAIRYWPPYPTPYEDLDYALRQNGWLDQFAESDRIRRLAAWRRGRLVGFSILTDITNDDAEFYIAVHSDCLHEGVGRDVTIQTLRYGFERLGLKQIHLKVRPNHSRGIALYESVGFVKTGQSPHAIPGRSTQIPFDDMTVTAAQFGYHAL